MAGRAGFLPKERRGTISRVSRLHDGVPAFKLETTSRMGGFRIIKRIVADPRRDVVLQKIALESLDGTALRLLALLGTPAQPFRRLCGD
jgi:glucoamylase